ncbi:MAG TPA: hypothetical protein PLX06_00815 [Fimbriimonadaceae bacterium]|nr:hypothetical protein [Fimbriimonadaceae bacterium]
MTHFVLNSHLALMAALSGGVQANPLPSPQLTEMAGYLIVPHERVAPTYNAGFSMYVAAWPLLKSYPGQDFQSGLFGTWMFPQFEGQAPKDHHTDIEGGLGWWRDTRFATETPKFIMGGVALNFSEWANGPGAGKGRNWKNPTGLYGVAQLSPWVLWPPDGLNLKQGTRGELFGYGYLPLPLTDPKSTTTGRDVPTGNHCWTLFLSTANFKGPVAFFTPYFWSKASAENPKLSGQFLDTRPSEPNKAVQMETQHVPAMVAKDRSGNLFARIAPTHFPGESSREAPLIHRITAYTKNALWNDVDAWFRGGPAANGAVSETASSVHLFKGGGYSTWKIYLPGEDRAKAAEVDWASYATPVALSDLTYGIRWNRELLSRSVSSRSLVTLPEYYRLTKLANGKERWVVVPAQEVPSETGLQNAKFPAPKRQAEPYVTPEEPGSAWKKPGPAAGPFKRVLGDGSEVTFSWYRFADQPAMQNADLTAVERQAIQKRVEKIHRTWTKSRDYLPPPTVGRLASLDPALMVKPPEGLEVGYVPIVTRQGWKSAR